MSSPSKGSLCLQVAAIIAAAVIAQRQADHETDEADMSLAYSGGSGRVRFSLQRLIFIANGTLDFMHPRSCLPRMCQTGEQAQSFSVYCYQRHLVKGGSVVSLRAPDVVSAVSWS